MIDTFESTARSVPDQVFFTFVGSNGIEVAYTYRQARLIAASFARYLVARGVEPNDVVVLDLPNSPELVFLILAAAYGAFTVVVMDQEVSEADKLLRLYDIRRDGLNVVCTITPHVAAELMVYVRGLFVEGGDTIAGLDAIIEARQASATLQRPSVAAPGSRNSGPLPRLNVKRSSAPLPHVMAPERPSVSSPLASPERLERTSKPIMGEQQDIIEEAVHYAERESHLFNPDVRGVILFTPTTAGKFKAVPLTWRQLTASAQSACAALMTYGAGLWQAALPFSHASGLAALVRSVENRSSLRIYEVFDALRVLNDAEVRHATHIAVTDRMLRDMLAVEEARASESLANAHITFSQAVEAGMFTSEEAMRLAAAQVRPTAAILSRLATYQGILIVGGALNPTTVERAQAQSAPIYATYGVTETSSLVATTAITPDFTGGMQLLAGYSARIIDPDGQGFGRLALRGPGVFDGYLNARAAFTVDGFFLTGDIAALHNGCIYVVDKDSEQFSEVAVAARPTELAEVLKQAPGATDAHLFTALDDRGLRVPIAMVERSDEELTAESLYAFLAAAVPTMEPPTSMALVDELPRRMGIVDGERVEAMWNQRIEVRRVVLHFVRMPLRRPARLGPVKLAHRDCVIVEVFDHLGRSGLGECAASVRMEDDGYNLGEDIGYLQQELVPALVGRPLMHARDAAALFAALPGASSYPAVTTALEGALWDLQGQVLDRPLWSLLNEEYERLRKECGVEERTADLPRAAHIESSQALVASSRTLGAGTPERTVEAVRTAAEAGYRRLKLRITPETKLVTLHAVQNVFPGMITLDANRTFQARDSAKLEALDMLGAAWIEEPLDPASNYDGRHSPIAQVANLQRKMNTPLAIDESYGDAAAAERVLQFVDLRLICIKIPKFGGVEAALRFLVQAQGQGREVVVGAPFGTGVMKRLTAAFETLPGVLAPGDIDAPMRVFETDITWPTYGITRGYLVLNGQGYEAGLGCELDEDALDQVLVKRTTIE